MYSVWTNKPTPRSGTARLRSNTFKGFGNDNVFLSACIVIMFNMMAVQDKWTLKTKLSMNGETKSLPSVIV